LVIETPEHAEERPAPGRRLALAVATGAGAGYAPVAPGTFGSAVGVLIYLLLSGLGAALFALTVVGLLFLGIWAAEEAERVFAREDDGRIVIDEVVGQLVSLAPLVALAAPDRVRSPLLLVTGFVAFRVFDIWKPGPVRWAERRFRGGAGVVMDDVVAGLFSAVVVAAALMVSA
jgi:phosphatidylglycerophosphatase A